MLMEIKEIHKWEVSCQEALALQETLKLRLIILADKQPPPIKTIAGADIALCRRENLLLAYIVVLSYTKLELLEETHSFSPASFPYRPGLLSFREGPALLKAFSRLKTTPDAVIFDGQGIAHPRGIGLASHLGLFLDIPTLGCAKKRLAGFHETVGDQAGNWSDLTSEGRIIGAALRTKSGVKPVYISPGHKMGIGGALAITLSCCRGFRLPEPARLAHKAVTRLSKEYLFSLSDGPGN